ncbi:MAG: class I SAM-dependent methyltransferase [Leptolyngbyaceae cyanobacterium SM1_3_5]|nr:class I SAM-dependent methyltransferase [Leptolyngbyaceae cyanobacterium SM1_3_5]
MALRSYFDSEGKSVEVRITSRASAIIAAASALILLITAVRELLVGENRFVTASAVSTAAIFCGLFESHRILKRANEKNLNELQRTREELKQTLKNDFRQVEALMSLFFTTKPDVPLPNTREWAASPDLLKKIAEIVLTKKPELVLEASSGISTLIIAYCLKQLGCGRVVSLEHDLKYAMISQDLILLHGLEKIATVIYAPLEEVAIREKQWLWYSMNKLKLDRPIDLFVIDGPPSLTQKLARYPALPLLFNDLSDNATIILDDGYREDENEIVELWQQEFKQITSELLDLEKGAFIISKHAA